MAAFKRHGARRALLGFLAAGVLAPAMLAAGEPPAPPAGAKASPVLQALEAELGRSLEQLKTRGEHPFYFLSYTVWETRDINLGASYGVLTERPATKIPARYFTVSARVGSRALDNTHSIRGGYGWGFGGGGGEGLPPRTTWTPSARPCGSRRMGPSRTRRSGSPRS